MWTWAGPTAPPGGSRSSQSSTSRARSNPFALHEDLVLENPERERYRLIRTLTHESGLAATLQMEGRYPAILIEQMELLPPGRQFQIQDGVPIARNYRIKPDTAAKPGVEAFCAVLRSAEARLPHLTLLMDTQSGFKMPGDVTLMRRPEHPVAPPDDLLAVLGWSWRPLRVIKDGWRGTLKLARREPKRTGDAEKKLARTVRHLARTLAEPPSRFHTRFYWARWRVLGRKVLGLSVVVGAFVIGPLILALDLPHDSVWRMLAFNTPPFLMLAVFLIPDLPQVRIPALPRPLPDSAWEPIGEPNPAPIADPVGRSLATSKSAPSPIAEIPSALPDAPAAKRRGWLTRNPLKAAPQRAGLLRSLWSLARRRA